MNNTCKIIGMAVLAGVASAAQAQVVFNDDFESYASGANIHGQGGWKGWDNGVAAGAMISTAQAASGTKSVNISGGSDLVHEFGYTGGQYNLSISQYIPSSSSGTTYFILMNRYADGGAGNNWSVQIPINLDTGAIVDDMAANEVPTTAIEDAWVNWTFTIDLNANLVGTYYNGQFFSEHAWQTDGAAALGAIDLYANNAGAVYYDDLVIEQVPEPTVLALVGLGGFALCRRRRNG